VSFIFIPPTLIESVTMARRGASSGHRWGKSPPLWVVVANILNKRLRTADKGCSEKLRVGLFSVTTRQRRRL